MLLPSLEAAGDRRLTESHGMPGSGFCALAHNTRWALLCLLFPKQGRHISRTVVAGICQDLAPDCAFTAAWLSQFPVSHHGSLVSKAYKCRACLSKTILEAGHMQRRRCHVATTEKLRVSISRPMSLWRLLICVPVSFARGNGHDLPLDAHEESYPISDRKDTHTPEKKAPTMLHGAC
jgi:hypothetical protein